MPTSLLTLPNELLLHIADHLEYFPRCRRRELLALTATCKRLNEVATGLLHSELCINKYELVYVLELYISRPELARKVRSLELYEPNEPSRSTGQTLRIRYEALESYTHFIHASGLSHVAKKELVTELTRRRDFTAVFALAIIMLPNMHQLLLGTFTSDKDDISMIFETCTDNVVPKNYFKEAFSALALRLKVLEMPHLWPGKGCGHPRGDSNSTFNGLSNKGMPANIKLCPNLEELYISLLGFVGCERDQRFPIWRYAPLPVSLRKLILAYPNLSQSMLLLEDILSNKNCYHLPNLTSLQLYMNARNPAQNNAIFEGEAPDVYNLEEVLSPKAEVNFSRRIEHFIKGLEDTGVMTILHWSHYRSIFSPITSLVGESVYPSHQLRVIEMRGCLDYLRPEAKAMGRRLREKELVEREERHRERRERGEESESSDEEWCPHGLYD
ncbi:hypothetical protein CC86DRAFT_373859 [Ophiobolus disseminans]|uniref:F-box domain-containing protein n=1 Tax=Ophiobolus disseminans TaxID=1469910 RepID=A0A6A6ZLB0_9PLEO|nr:hypothetical protein CC86DRAFT_373859 [Ophiobolus disseminans]